MNLMPAFTQPLNETHSAMFSDLRDGERRVLRVVDRLPARDPAGHARREPPQTGLLALHLLGERGHRRVGLRLQEMLKSCTTECF